MFFYPSTNDISNGACELPYEIIFTMGKVGKWWVIFNTRLTLFSAPCVNRVNFLRNKKSPQCLYCRGLQKLQKKANSKNKSLFVKLSGMRKKEGIREEGKRLEKERGKEDKKYPTMPHVIFSYYRVRKTGRKGQAFSANID